MIIIIIIIIIINNNSNSSNDNKNNTNKKRKITYKFKTFSDSVYLQEMFYKLFMFSMLRTPL